MNTSRNSIAAWLCERLNSGLWSKIKCETSHSGYTFFSFFFLPSATFIYLKCRIGREQDLTESWDFSRKLLRGTKELRTHKGYDYNDVFEREERT